MLRESESRDAVFDASAQKNSTDRRVRPRFHELVKKQPDGAANSGGRPDGERIVKHFEFDACPRDHLL